MDRLWRWGRQPSWRAEEQPLSEVRQEQLWEPEMSAVAISRVARLTGLANRAGGAFTGGAANSSRSSPPNLPDALIGGDGGSFADGGARAADAAGAAGRLIG